MAAPPLLRVFHFRQNKERFHRFENVFRQHCADDGLGAADVQIEIVHAAFGFAHHPLHDGAAARRHELHADTVAPRERDLHPFAQFGARWNRCDDFAFLLGRLDDLVPVGGLGLSDRKTST